VRKPHWDDGKGLAMPELHYDSLLLRREGVTRDLPAGDNDDLRWVANSVTLIYGDHDAVLVDSFVTIEQNERLVDWVKAHDRSPRPSEGSPFRDPPS
jgi:hypothetical protein